MRKYALLVLGLLFLASPAVRARPAAGQNRRGRLGSPPLGGYRVGSFHVVTREFDVKGGKVTRTTARLDMTLKPLRAATTSLAGLPVFVVAAQRRLRVNSSWAVVCSTLPPLPSISRVTVWKWPTR